MAMDVEAIVDRRRLRRKLTFWRVLGIAALIGAVVVAGAVLRDRNAIGQAHVARISIGGLITGSQQMTDLLERVGESKSVAGVVLSISSPGGTTTGSEELYHGIRRLAEKKPLVAFVDGTAASGAYIAALGADRIVARETSLVGSIGVIMQYPQVSELLAKLGIAVEDIKSSPLKAEPSGVRPTPPEARAALQRVVDDTYDWFKTLVASRRNYSSTELDGVSDGRVFSGRQALTVKLVDELGEERDAIAWLERDKGVAKNLPVRDWRPRTGRDFSLWNMAAFLADGMGFEKLAGHMRDTATAITIGNLDGLVAVWHPSFEK